MIDAEKTALVEGLRLAPGERGKGVACLLQRFCPQLARRQRSGVKVAQPSRDDQRDPQELKYRLNTQQVRRTKGLGVPPTPRPVFFLCRFYRVRALPWTLPRPRCQGEVKQLPTPNPRSLLLETKELRSLDFGDPASHVSILFPFRNPNS